MEPTPNAAAGRRRRRHPAARSRVVAGALSAVLFLGLGAGMAAGQTSADTTASAAVSGSASAQEDTGSASSGWAATPGRPRTPRPFPAARGAEAP